MKKFVLFLITAVLVGLTLFMSLPAAAAGGTVNDVDVVFLIDASRSMTKSDPDGLRLTAIKLFSDLCDLEKTRIGFVLFGDDVIYRQDLTAIDSESDRASIKATIDGLGDVSGSTDIGAGMKAAVDCLTSGSSANSDGRFIVFLSDGKTVIPKERTDRTLEDSEKDLNDAVRIAAENTIPIYTIGLNASNDVDEEELRKISAATFASDTHVTNSASELSQILSEIYAHHSGAGYETLHSYVSDGGYENINFKISDRSVVAANLVVMHEDGVDDIKLYDASGNEVDLTSGNISVAYEKAYSRIKIYQPSTGEWMLSVKAPKAVSVEVKLIMSHEFTVDMGIVSSAQIGQGSVLKFTSELNDAAGAAVDDDMLLSSLSGTVTIRDAETNEEYSAEMQRNGNVFNGEFELPNDHTYTVQTVLLNDSINIRSNIQRLEYGSDDFLPPDNSGTIILIVSIVGGVIVLLALAVLAIKAVSSVGEKLVAGRLNMSITVQGAPNPPCAYDIARNSGLKRMITMRHVLYSVYSPDQADRIMPASVSGKIKITLKDGCIRFSNVKNVTYSGGTPTRNCTAISNRGRITMQYTDPNISGRNVIVITYNL